MSTRIIIGDARNMSRLKDESVQCCVTSPPYWGLRDYGTAKWEGGDPNCKHGGRIMGNANKGNTREVMDGRRTRCHHCGAKRVDDQLGLEPTVELYVEHMVEVFREVKRVLRKDGTLWLNLGDSYMGSGGAHKEGHANPGLSKSSVRSGVGNAKKAAVNLKPKDLVGVPWRVAFALQQDGWYLRSDIIWAKSNSMPSSVTDRPATSHEYVFLLSKSKTYFYDSEAVKEDCVSKSVGLAADFKRETKERIIPGQSSAQHRVSRNHTLPTLRRNRRTIWTVPVHGFKGAHFATFPPKLIEPCILAGTSEIGACPKCGSPWRRVVNKSGGTIGKSWHDHGNDSVAGMSQDHNFDMRTYSVKTEGWTPTCKCGVAEVVPCVVLDPFMGSGTTAVVANAFGRDAVGTELNPKYALMARDRISAAFPMLDQVIIEGES